METKIEILISETIKLYKKIYESRDYDLEDEKKFLHNIKELHYQRVFPAFIKSITKK